MGFRQMCRILLLLFLICSITAQIKPTKFEPSDERNAAEIFKFAQENREFCGLENCYYCLHLLQQRAQGHEALARKQISAYWTCTIIWLWNQCCPQWSSAVQM